VVLLVHSGPHDSVYLLGVNTNSCVIVTAISASVRDLAAFVIDASFGWIVGAATTFDVLSGGSA
jgi:nicotinamidase-related amidase